MDKESGIVETSTAAQQCSGTESDSSSDGRFFSPPANKVKRQSFRAAWLKNPQFVLWLEEAEEPHQAKCSVCVKFLSATTRVLRRHANNITHITNMRKKAGASIYAHTDAAITSDTSIAGPSGVAEKCSDTETDSSSEHIFTVPSGHKIARQQTFRDVWLEDPQFKSWLVEIQDNPYKAKCKICLKSIVANKTTLHHHGNSKTHIMNMRHREELMTKTDKKTFQELVKVAEMRVCMDAVEHNRPFESYCHTLNLLQTALPLPDILPHMTLSSKKMGAIVKNVINKTIIEDSTETLQGKLFSVLIDETTDISDTKILCFLIRYVEKDQIQNYLLDLIGISDGTADNIYNCFLHSLKKNNLALSNMVGMCVDNANVMMGAHNSVTSRLLTDNPDVYVFPCICRSMHLVASHAFKCLPSFVDDFLHVIYSYLARSPKRLSHLQELQEFMKVEQVKVLQPSATRWLAVSDCVERVLNQWGPLFSTTATAVFENESEVAVKIFNFMNDRFTKPYLEFLSYALGAIIHTNKLFQTSTVVSYCLHSECYKLLRFLATNFIKTEYIGRSDLHKIDVEKEENLLALETIYPGSKCVNSLREIENSNGEGDREKITEFYRNVKKFYQTAFLNMVKRIPFDDIFLESLDFLNPVIALDLSQHRTDHLASILYKFKSKNFNEAAVIDEWRLMGCFWTDADKAEMRALDIVQFWRHIGSRRKVSEGPYNFENILKLAQLCLLLPHSNVDVERYLSQVTLIKTKDRNRLKTDTVAALTRIKYDLKNSNANYFKYKLTDRMLNLFNAKMYSADAIPQQLKGILLPEEPDESDSASESEISDTSDTTGV